MTATKREAVQRKTPGGAESCKRDAAEHGSDDAREVELNGIERDRVGNILDAHEARDQRLIGGASERLGESRKKREAEDVPDLHQAGG